MKNCIFFNVYLLRFEAFLTTLFCAIPFLAGKRTGSTWIIHSENVNRAIENFVLKAEESNLKVLDIVIIQHGKSLANWQAKEVETSVLFDQHELSATVTAMAVGLAEDEGLLGLDDKVAEFFPDLLPAQPSANLQAMTIRHLLTMTSGHDKDTPCNLGENWAENYLAQPVPHTPGSYFYYDPMAGYMLSAILQKVTGQSLSEYLQTSLFEPLGIKIIEWESSPQGLSAGGWGLHATTQDMARIGSLLVQKGKWEGRRLLPRKWVKQMLNYQTASCPKDVRYEELPQSGLSLYENDWIQGFGYQTWLCRDVRTIPHQTLLSEMGFNVIAYGKNINDPFFRAEGNGGQYLIMIPEYDACIAVNAKMDDMAAGLKLIYSHLIPAMPDWRGEKQDFSRTQTRHHNLHYVNSHL